MAGGEGDGLIGHSVILQAVSDLRSDLRRSDTSREQTEQRLFVLIDEVKADVSGVQGALARLEGERAGERHARAEAGGHALLAVQPPAQAPATAAAAPMAGWQRFGMWAAIVAAVIGILGGVGQAVHFIVTVGSAIYQSGKPPGH